MHKNIAHTKRIEEDLKKAGISSYGLLKSETRELPKIIAEDEPIYGCIYGQYSGGSAMMVATDRRVIFLDKKPLHLMLEEMSFDKIIDIGADWQPLFSKVVINARADKYVFRYVNTNCARKFVRFLETAVLGLPDAMKHRDDKVHHYRVTAPKHFDTDESRFLSLHYICVVSTNGKNGYPYGATMFYFPDDSENVIRLVTRSETETAQNIRRNRKLALTITDEQKLATMHITGDAILDDDPKKGYEVVQSIISDNPHVPKHVVPPVAQINDGAYVVLKIVVASSYLHVYKTTPQ